MGERDANFSRRTFVRAGAVTTLLGASGCLRLTESETGASSQPSSETATGTRTIRDSDGDGVVDSEDYAPNDPAVQEKSDVTTDTASTTEQSANTDTPTESETSTRTATATAIPETVVEGFESGAYDDDTPVTWSVESPGEEMLIQDDHAIADSRALTMVSGAGDGNHAILSHRAPERTIGDGDEFHAWLRTDTDGRAYYRLGTKPEPDSPHEIAACLLADRGSLQIQTRDASGQQLESASMRTGTSDRWYRFEMTIRPTSNELAAQVYDRENSLLATQTVETSGHAVLEYTPLHVPKPNGQQVLGQFDDVTIRT